MMILEQILARTRDDLPARKSQRPLAELQRQAAGLPPARSLAAALRRPGAITAIAEFKRRSPSKGWIHEHAKVAEVVPAYVGAGAAALSILTDEPFFGGSLGDLTEARALCDVPILRKDFIVDEYQIAEARVAGADAILLIVAALDDATLRALLAACARYGVEALVETHDAAEVARALATGARVLGINHRDLRTFQMDQDLAVRLRPSIPADRVLVAESGIRAQADVARLRAAAIDAILVGETLMRASDPAAALRGLLA
jgi:indole-3-glycerol phosphate synthase